MSTITHPTPRHQTGSDSVDTLRNRFTALRLSFTWLEFVEACHLINANRRQLSSVLSEPTSRLVRN